MSVLKTNIYNAMQSNMNSTFGQMKVRISDGGTSETEEQFFIYQVDLTEKDFPAGRENAFYLDTHTNNLYRWNGENFVPITSNYSSINAGGDVENDID